MRKLIEQTVYKNFAHNGQGLYHLSIGSPLYKYLEPISDLDYKEVKLWLTATRLKKVRWLLKSLSNKELLRCLTDQHCEQFR